MRASFQNVHCALVALQCNPKRGRVHMSYALYPVWGCFERTPSGITTKVGRLATSLAGRDPIWGPRRGDAQATRKGLKARTNVAESPVAQGPERPEKMERVVMEHSETSQGLNLTTRRASSPQFHLEVLLSGSLTQLTLWSDNLLSCACFSLLELQLQNIK